MACIDPYFSRALAAEQRGVHYDDAAPFLVADDLPNGNPFPDAIRYETQDDFVAALERDIAAGAPTMLPPALPCVRDRFVVSAGIHPLFLYRLEPDGGIAAGDDRRRAVLMTAAEAESCISALGDSWRVGRAT